MPNPIRTDQLFNAHSVLHEAGEMALLPSPFATLLWCQGQVELFGPHGRLYRLQPAESAFLLFCAPNFIKALLGHPRYFLNQRFSVQELPLLAPFQQSAPTDWPGLLQDLRAAVTMTQDEYQFTELWQQLLSQHWPITGAAPERQAERLCQRYAGQPPTAIGRQLRLAAQLANDLMAGSHQPTGAYADQSHFIRECRQQTGRAPGEWQNLSARFYHCDTTVSIIARPALETTKR